jgi:hypothetical protein
LADREFWLDMADGEGIIVITRYGAIAFQRPRFISPKLDGEIVPS